MKNNKSVDPQDAVPFAVRNFSEASIKGTASDLIRLAREALQEKRLGNCLTLASAVLQMDPENRDARLIQLSANADLEQGFQLALKLASEARRHSTRGTWGAVRFALQRVLSAAPGHEGARALLVEALAAAQLSDAEPDDSAEIQGPSDGRRLPFEPVLIHKRPKWLIAAGATGLVLLVVFGFFAFKRFQLQAIGSALSLPASPAGQGTLTIQVDDGLRLFVDGQYRGTAPVPAMTLPTGKHQVRYESNGVVLDQEEVEITRNGSAANTAGRLVGRLDLLIVPTSGVELTVDDIKVGPPPPFVLLKPGPHRLVFIAEGRSTEMLNVIITAGERRLIPVLLQKT